MSYTSSDSYRALKRSKEREKLNPSNIAEMKLLKKSREVEQAVCWFAKDYYVIHVMCG